MPSGAGHSRDALRFEASLGGRLERHPHHPCSGCYGAGNAMTRQHFWLSLLALLLAVVAPRPAASQVGTTTDIITGTVTGLDSQPLAGAVVQATSLETQVSRQHVTDSRGRFTIVFPDGGGRYELTARFIGLAPVQLSVGRQTDVNRVAADIRIGLLSG